MIFIYNCHTKLFNFTVSRELGCHHITVEMVISLVTKYLSSKSVKKITFIFMRNDNYSSWLIIVSIYTKRYCTEIILLLNVSYFTISLYATPVSCIVTSDILY